MTLEVDFSLGLRGMANTEAVTFTSRRRQGDVVDRIDGVMRRQLNGREGAPSGGTYTFADVGFLIPRERIQALLLQDRQPKEGDLVTDDLGTEFTALNVNGLMRGPNGYELWQVNCRDLVLANDLRDVIDLESPKISLDPAGVKVKDWAGGSVRRNVPARVQPLTQELAEQFGMTGLKGTYAVICGRQIAVSYEWRIRWRDHSTTPSTLRYLDIVDVRNPERIDELPVIGAEQRL